MPTASTCSPAATGSSPTPSSGRGGTSGPGPSRTSIRQAARRRNDRHTKNTGTDENRFESADDAFYARAYATYKTIAAREPQRVALIEDDASIDDIHTKIITIVANKLRINL